MAGRIYLTQERMERCVRGVDKMGRGEKTTFEEEDALFTLWHEITHNRNKPGAMPLTKRDERYMELANEFVARKTLPEFFEALGGELQTKELMTNVVSSGYNTITRNFDALIDATRADRTVVTKAVQEALFNRPYDEQQKGLVDALLKGGAQRKGKPLTRKQVNGCLKAVIELKEDEMRDALEVLFAID